MRMTDDVDDVVVVVVEVVVVERPAMRLDNEMLARHTHDPAHSHA